MRFKLPVVTSLIVCTLGFGCGGSSMPGSRPTIQVAQGKGVPVPGVGEAAAPPIARKIIYTSQIDVVVENITTAQQKLTSLIESVRERGGFLARQELTGH